MPFSSTIAIVCDEFEEAAVVGRGDNRGEGDQLSSVPCMLRACSAPSEYLCHVAKSLGSQYCAHGDGLFQCAMTHCGVWALTCFQGFHGHSIVCRCFVVSSKGFAWGHVCGVTWGKGCGCDLAARRFVTNSC